MAPQNPAAWLQNRGDHPAVLMRMAFAGLVNRYQSLGTGRLGDGVHPIVGNKLAVTGTSGMSVNVNDGLCYMASATAYRGTYTGYNDASYSVAISASNSSQWRRDYIAARPHDTAYGDADNNWDIVPIQGAWSSSSPGALPALPDGAVPLAIVAVVPNMTVTNGAGTVTDARYYVALSGPIPVLSTGSLPGTSLDGVMWAETDTHLLGVSLNNTHKYIAILPNVVGASDTPHSMPAMQNGWSIGGSAKYKMDIAGNLCISFQNLSCGSANTNDATAIWASGSLPAAYQPPISKRVPCYADVLRVSAGQTYNNEGPALLFNTDGSIVCYGIGGPASRVDCHAVIPLAL